MLMIIGGSPAGTAGGIKTTTVAVLLLTAISVLRGNKDTECYGRKITFEIIRVGMTITLVTFVFWLFGVTVMTVIEPQQKVLDLMFEATSAMATVGLTADLTPVLSDISHVVLMLMMYIGRIGPNDDGTLYFPVMRTRRTSSVLCRKQRSWLDKKR